MPEYSQRDLWYPALELLAAAPGGLTTTDLIRELSERLKPSGHDAQILAGRRDTHFSQKVRNLAGSHRDSALAGAGYVVYRGRGQAITITQAGRRALADAQARGGWRGFDERPGSELGVREGMWVALLAAGGPSHVAPALLNDLSIFRGGRGIWVDTEATRVRDLDGLAATISVLHRGRVHAEELTETELRYHYPATERPGRDAAEIDATKRAAELQLPVFVITTAADATLRDVRRAYVTGFDDAEGVFVLGFADTPLLIAPARNRRRSTGMASYRRANEVRTAAPRQPFDVDPDAVDRANASHNVTQNALADWATAHAMVPLSPPGGWADFDVAWEHAGRLFVAEVKSLTASNEVKQLRLGLGQVLHYQSLLEDEGHVVVPVLAIPHAPGDNRWFAICARFGVRLVWPETFDTVNDAGA